MNKSTSTDGSASKKKRRNKNNPSVSDHRNRILDVLSKPRFAEKEEDEQLSRRAADLVCDVLRSIEAEKDDDDDDGDHIVCGANGVRSSPAKYSFPLLYANDNRVTSSFATKKKSARGNDGKATSTTTIMLVGDRQATPSPADNGKEAAAASQVVANTTQKVKEGSSNENCEATGSVLKQTREIETLASSNDGDKIIRESMTTDIQGFVKDDEYTKSSKTHLMSDLDKSNGVSEVDVEVIKGFLLRIEEIVISALEKRIQAIKHSFVTE